MTGPTQTSPPSRSTETRDAGLPAGGARVGTYPGPESAEPPEMRDPLQAEQYAQRAVELTRGADAYALDTLADAPAGQPTAWVGGLLEAKLTHSQEAAKGVRQ